MNITQKVLVKNGKVLSSGFSIVAHRNISKCKECIHKPYLWHVTNQIGKLYFRKLLLLVIAVIGYGSKTIY